MAQIEPIEIFGFENKGVFLNMYGQHPFGENKTLKAEIIDVFGNVLFTRILVYGTTEDVAQQLGLTLKTNKMAQQSSIDWLIEEFYLYYNGSMQFTYREIIEQSKEKHKEDCINFSIEWENRRDDEEIKDKEDLYDKIYNK